MYQQFSCVLIYSKPLLELSTLFIRFQSLARALIGFTKFQFSQSTIVWFRRYDVSSVIKSRGLTRLHRGVASGWGIRGLMLQMQLLLLSNVALVPMNTPSKLRAIGLDCLAISQNTVENYINYIILVLLMRKSDYT